MATCVGKKGPCANTSAAAAYSTRVLCHALGGMISRSEKATLKEKKKNRFNNGVSMGVGRKVVVVGGAKDSGEGLRGLGGGKMRIKKQ